MAKVIVKVLGNPDIKEHDVDSVGDLKELLGLANNSASVNGVAKENDFQLSEGQLVTLAPSVKGGNK